jgi:hypothetical protein
MHLLLQFKTVAMAANHDSQMYAEFLYALTLDNISENSNIPRAKTL